MTRADLPYLMGILFIALGAFCWAMSGILSRIASSSYAYLRPGRNKDDFRSRSAAQHRPHASPERDSEERAMSDRHDDGHPPAGTCQPRTRTSFWR